MANDLLEWIDRLGQPRVLVLGDVMLDRYIWGDAERISQEAPVILLRADQREERLGGASSVATMLRALDAQVVLAGVVGDDNDALRLRRLLEHHGIDTAAVFTDESRPTTVKERYVGKAQQRHPQQILRVDYETREPLAAVQEQRFASLLARLIPVTEVVLISDYDKGVCTPGLVQRVIQEAKTWGKPVLVDPIRCKSSLPVPHPYDRYAGCAAMTPNRLEASLATGVSIHGLADAFAAGQVLLERFGLEAAIVTLDKDGMALVQRDGRQEHFPTRPRQVYDITGAGDMVLSVLGLAVAAGADYPTAIRLANIAGGLEVEKIGVAPVSRWELIQDIQAHLLPQRQELRKVRTLASLLPELEVRRQQGQRIVFTNGCFDLLHAGHVQYLAEARAQGDLLVVGLNSDASVRGLKGPTRPINHEQERAEVLAGLSAVDFITIFDEATPLRLIQAIRPQVLVKGADYRKEEVVGADFVESLGGRVHLAGLRSGASTTGTLLKLQTGTTELRQVA